MSVNDNLLVTLKSFSAVIDEMKKGKLRKQAARLEKILNLFDGLRGNNEDAIRMKIKSKYYLTELEFLKSSICDVRGLKDLCPDQLSYEEWRGLLSALEDDFCRFEKSLSSS